MINAIDDYEPPPVDWPDDDSLWAHEFNLEQLTDCVCDGSGWLPLANGEAMTACWVCNIELDI